MGTMALLRYACLLLPMALLLWGLHVERDRRARGGALLAFIAAAVGVAALHEVALACGWYAFAPVHGAHRGLPVDVWLGWAALWGPVPVLLRRHLPLPVTVAALGWLDVVTMPELEPLLRLGPHWLLAELVGLAVVLVPAQLLGRFTARRRHLRTRTLLQVVVFSALALWLVPSVAFTLGDGGWHELAALPYEWLIVLAQVAGLIAVPGLSAVGEFLRRGGGTPFPWDPPRRLVTTGPYAYVANPMQLSAVLLVLLLAAATRSGTLAVAAALAVAFSAGVAAPHEDHDLACRHGPAWRRWRGEVRSWWPRWRPYRDMPAGRLWLDDGCGPCAALGRRLGQRRRYALTLLPAATYPGTLWRARYMAADGHTADGVAAVARGLEHVHFGWAWLGWLLRLPPLDRLAQLISDALIAAPHPVGDAPPAHRGGP